MTVVFTPRRWLARVLAVVVSVCVRLSVTSRCSTEMAKRRITQTTPHDSPASAENPGKIQTGSPPTEAPNAVGVG